MSNTHPAIIGKSPTDIVISDMTMPKMLVYARKPGNRETSSGASPTSAPWSSLITTAAFRFQ